MVGARESTLCSWREIERGITQLGFGLLARMNRRAECPVGCYTTLSFSRLPSKVPKSHVALQRIAALLDPVKSTNERNFARASCRWLDCSNGSGVFFPTLSRVVLSKSWIWQQDVSSTRAQDHVESSSFKHRVSNGQRISVT
jgi:hypothetical protein